MSGAGNRNSFWYFGVYLPVFVGAIFALHGITLWWFSDQAFSDLFWILEQTVVVTGVTGLSALCLLRLKSPFSRDQSETVTANPLPEGILCSQAGRIGQIGFWCWKFEGDNVVCSEKVFDILGLDQAVTKPSLSSFLRSVHPEERGEIDRWFRNGYKMTSESASECRILHPDGSVRWVELRIGPLIENDVQTGACGTLKDVTERTEYLNEIRALNARQEEFVEQKTAELREEITKRKAIQAELEFSEARHRNTIDSAADAIISIDPNDRIVLANRAVKSIFGFCNKDVVGQPVTVLLNAPTEDIKQNWINRLLETGQHRGSGRISELEARRADGSLFPIELSVSEVSISGNQHFTMIIRDITKRKRTEREIRRNAERLREILENCPLGVSILSYRDLQELFVNKRSIELRGFPDAGPGGVMDIRDTFVGGAFPQSLKDQIVAGHTVSDFEVERIRADGSRWWSLLSARKIDFEGIPSVISWQADITERKQWEKKLLAKEEQFRSTINNAPAGIILTDKDKKIVVANDQLRDILNVPRDMMESGKDYMEVIRYVCERGDLGPDVEHHRKAVRHSLENPNARRHHAYTATSGKIYSVHRHAVGDGSVVTIAVDMTEQKKDEEHLQQALRDLKQAQDEIVEAGKLASLGSLIAGVAHEINTPIGTSLTASTHVHDETLKISAAFENNTVKRSELAGYLAIASEGSKIIETNLKRAGSLIRSFKQVAVDQSSEERRSFDVDSYLAEIIQSLKPQLKTYPHVKLVLEANAGAVINSFPGAFSQILSNLLVNALTHAFEHDSEGQVVIRTRTSGNQMEISFEDNGRGMDATVRERIFEPFFTTRRGSGGSGLGLHIVYNLVMATLDGTIRCFSNPEAGTRFEITIPINSEATDV